MSETLRSTRRPSMGIRLFGQTMLAALLFGSTMGCATIQTRMAAEQSYKTGETNLTDGDATAAVESFKAGLDAGSTSAELNARLYAGLAQAYARSNRLDAAVEAAEKGVQLYADDTTLVALAEVRLLTRDPQGAFDSAKAAVEHCNVIALSNPDIAKPCYSKTQLTMAQVMRATSNYEYALERLEAAFKAGSKESVILAEKAQILNLQGDPAGGMALANEALEKNPGLESALLARGTSEAISGDVSSATKTLQPIVAKNPIATLEFLRVARTFVTSKDYERATELYELVATIQAENPYVWMDLGYTYDQSGRLDDAITAYKKVLSTDKSIATYVATEDVAAFKTAIETTPPESDRLDFMTAAYTNLGTVLVRKGMNEEATDIFARAQVCNPSDLQVALALSDLYAQSGNNDGSIDVLLAALPQVAVARDELKSKEGTITAEAMKTQLTQLNSIEADMEKRVGVMLYNAKRAEEAKPHLARAVELAPDDPNIQLGLGIVYFNEENYEAAIPPLKKALEVNPNDIGILLNLGVSYRRTGKNAEAIPLLEQAKKYDPRNKDIYGELYHAYKGIGDKKKAKDHQMMFQSLP